MEFVVDHYDDCYYFVYLLKLMNKYLIKVRDRLMQYLLNRFVLAEDTHKLTFDLHCVHFIICCHNMATVPQASFV